MAALKITQLQEATILAANDAIVFVDVSAGSSGTKKLTLQGLFGSIPTNTAITGTLTVSANTAFNGEISANTGRIKIVGPATVVSNNATTQLGTTGMAGSLFWDENYLYVAVSNTQIKRAALGVFS